MMIAALLALALQSADGFEVARPDQLPFTIAIPLGYQVTRQGVADHMTYRLGRGPEIALTLRGGIYAVPMFGMENQTGNVRQMVRCEAGVVVSRTVLLYVPLGEESLLVTTTPGKAAEADQLLTTLKIPGKHEGVALKDLMPCRS